MPRYKLRLPGPGEYLYGDDGTLSFIADTADEARDYFEEWEGARPEFVHSYIARGRVVYKRDVEGGDAHDDAEPGDTTFDYLRDDGRELRRGEIRAWESGVPRGLVKWMIAPLPFEPVDGMAIPVGVSVYHRRLGSGRTVGEPRRLSEARVVVDVAFGFPNETRRLVCSVTAVSFMPTRDWPQRRYRLDIDGEPVAEGTEAEMEALRAERVAEAERAWKDEHRRERTAA